MLVFSIKSCWLCFDEKINSFLLVSNHFISLLHKMSSFKYILIYNDALNKIITVAKKKKKEHWDALKSFVCRHIQTYIQVCNHEGNIKNKIHLTPLWLASIKKKILQSMRALKAARLLIHSQLFSYKEGYKLCSKLSPHNTAE